jgi:hypothetical protein
MSTGSVSVASPSSGSGMQLESITSGLTRVVHGIHIVESFAWAKMRTSGDVDMEAVFWPPVDMAIVNAATSFAANLADPGVHRAFLAKLPGPVQRDLGVVIHHTNYSIHSMPVAEVAYDVLLDDHASTVRHFDGSGAEFRLAHETLQAPNGQRVRR